MSKIIFAIAVVMLVMHAGTFVAYGSFSATFDLQPPAGVSPGQLFLAVFIMKLGVSIAFVLLFSVAREVWTRRWLLYAAIWFVMFAVIEVGQAVTPNYSWLEAVAGVIAEAIYFPLSAWLTVKILRGKSAPANSIDGPGQ